MFIFYFIMSVIRLMENEMYFWSFIRDLKRLVARIRAENFRSFRRSVEIAEGIDWLLIKVFKVYCVMHNVHVLIITWRMGHLPR